MNTQEFIREAKRLTDKKICNTKQNHIAIITRRNKTISIGYNKSRTHPMTQKYSYSPRNHICAELDAVLSAPIDTDFSKCNITVIRIRSNGTLALSKPCKGCSHMLTQLGFKNIYYSNNNHNIVKMENTQCPNPE